LPDYPLVVKHPMDLGTIKDLLLSSSLEAVDHFADHCRLVFNNSMTYNVAGSGIYLAAEHLLAEFERQYKQMQERHKLGPV